ncbi:MAG: PucR family transcriptional regulator ligand-binding domain-containing protein [Austwickia sp.]|nr:PucR family transcriptional regulator ligand-binding domain-containing protein [Austwickia sp.]
MGPPRGVTCQVAPPGSVAIPRMTLSQALGLECLSGAQVVAGRQGLERELTRVNVMEVPDILPWVQADELLLTTGYALRHDPEYLTDLVPQLSDRGLTGLAIKLGRYIEALPPPMVAAADRLGFPLVTLSDTAAFDDIIHGVLSSVLNPRMSMLEHAEAVLRTLVDVVLRGGDLEDVCHRLVVHGYRAVMVTTPEGEVVAEAAIDPGALPAVHALPCFDRAGRFKVDDEPPGMRRGVRGVESASEPTRLVARIAAGALDHGRIVAFADRGLTPVDLHLLERSAETAALVITKNQAVAAVESKYRSDFLRDALAGRAGPAELVIRHAKSLGWNLEGPLALVVAELDPGSRPDPGATTRHSQQDRFGAGWSQAVRVRIPGAAVVGRGHEVVCVLPVDASKSIDDLTKLVGTIATQVRRSGTGLPSFATGISRIVGSPDQLPEAYDKARTAMRVGRQMQGDTALVHFDALGVFRLLSLIGDSQELRSFVDETLGELADDSSPEANDLRETLTVLLDNNLNVAETARELHFHYNTLRYRITKLERMLGPFTTDPNARLSISLALRMLQMRRR